MIRRLFTSLTLSICAGICCVAGHSAFAQQSADQVLATIRANDTSMHHGTLDYDWTVPLIKGSSSDISLDGVRAHYKAQGLSDAQVEVEAQKYKRDMLFLQKTRSQERKLHLVFNDDHRFTLRTALVSSDHEDVTVQTYDGQDEFVISPDHNALTLRPGRPLNLNAAVSMISIYPGPAFVYGRGLSILQNPAVEIAGTQATIRGRSIDGTDITAVVDTTKGDVLKHLERRNNGQLISAWEYGPSVPTLSGPELASSAKYIQYNPVGAIVSVDLFTLKKADFSPPDPSIFSVALKPGLTIVDQRLGGSVVIHQAADHDITKDDLLKLSQRSLDEAIAIKKKVAVMDAARSNSVKIKVALVILLILSVISVAVVFGLRRKSTE